MKYEVDMVDQRRVGIYLGKKCVLVLPGTIKDWEGAGPVLSRILDEIQSKSEPT